MTETQRQIEPVTHSGNGTAENSVLPAGQFGKQELFFALRRGAVQYRSKTIYRFFTPERIQLCGYTTEELKRIRLFSPEACCIIRQELQKLNFL